MVYKTARRIVIAVIGGTVLLFSLVGYVMPIIPGIPLTILGLAILATEFIWARRLLRKVKSAAKDLMAKVTGNQESATPDSSDEGGEKTPLPPQKSAGSVLKTPVAIIPATSPKSPGR